MAVYYVSLAVCLTVVVLQYARMRRLEGMIDRLTSKLANLPAGDSEKGRVISPYKDKDGD